MSNVLVVDDDLMTLGLIAAQLEELGHTVETRSRAFGTTSYIMAHKPDVVLLDVEMPGLSGDEIAQVVRGRNACSKVSVILYSARGRRDLQRMAKVAGALGAIEKTGDLARFASEFQRLVGQPVQ
jgi:two-component system response regulator DesR